jgi:hypothetical protein
MVAVLCGLAAAAPAAATRAAVPLDAPITADWRGVALRDWAGRLAAAAATPVVVDRRLDPDTTVTLEAREEPLGRVLGRAAQEARGDVAVLRGHVRLVPAGAADTVLAGERARRAALGKLPPRQRAALETPREWTWPAGARPADIAGETATRAGATLEGLDRVPHDHLPAATFGGLSAAEILDLVLAHYDLRVDWRPGPAGRPGAGSATGRVVGITADLPAAGGDDEARTAAGGRPAADDRPPARGGTRGVPAGREPRESFTLRAAAPLDELLGTVAKRLGLELRLDKAALDRRGISPGEIVRLSVADASRKELLDAIVAPLGLRWRIADGRLEVSAPPE